MNFRLPHEERARTGADAGAKSAHVSGGEEQPKSPRRRRGRRRWKFPITDGPFAESKEMLGGLAVPQSPANADLALAWPDSRR